MLNKLSNTRFPQKFLCHIFIETNIADNIFQKFIISCDRYLNHHFFGFKKLTNLIINIFWLIFFELVIVKSFIWLLNKGEKKIERTTNVYEATNGMKYVVVCFNV